jgi:alpha-ketoglutarate-dependent taurine dioxygenase
MSTMPWPVSYTRNPVGVQSANELPCDLAELPGGVRAEPGLPLILRPTSDGPKDFGEVEQWYAESRTKLQALATRYGAVLLRDFVVPDSHAFGRLAKYHVEHQYRYLGGASPRARLSENVYESTRIDKRFKLALHQEKSYMLVYPRLIAFYCEQPSERGGETLLCDMRAVTRRLPQEIKDRFAQKGVRYRRNFRDRDRPDAAIEAGSLREYHRVWQEAFDSETRAAAQAHCEQAGLEFEWLSDGSLTVSNTCSALIRHPATGEEIWFNQCTTQHANARSMGSVYLLLQRFYSNRPAFPYEVQLGDGGSIALDDLAPVYDALDACETAVAWEKGDYLLIDNIHTAHGRNPYVGARAVRVALME